MLTPRHSHQVGQGPGVLPQPLLCMRPVLGSGQAAQGVTPSAPQNLQDGDAPAPPGPTPQPRTEGKVSPHVQPRTLQLRCVPPPVSICPDSAGPRDACLSHAFPPEPRDKVLTDKKLFVSHTQGRYDASSELPTAITFVLQNSGRRRLVRAQVRFNVF